MNVNFLLPWMEKHKIILVCDNFNDKLVFAFSENDNFVISLVTIEMS